jgi:hypothetical protein
MDVYVLSVMTQYVISKIAFYWLIVYFNIVSYKIIRKKKL